MLANAVHGSSTAERAEEVIQTFIGEVPKEEGEREGGEETDEAENKDGDKETGLLSVLCMRKKYAIVYICRWR